MEICKWCKKDEGVHQVYRQDPDGSKHPNGKLCEPCWVAFKTPSKKLQRQLKRDGQDVDIPCRRSCVVVRSGKVVTCDAELITEWLCAGYTVVGVADTEKGIQKLKQLAKGVR